MTTAPTELKDLQADLAAAFKLLNQRRPDYVKAQAYYEGDVAEMTAGNRQVQRVLQASAEAHKLIFANIPVDALFDKVVFTGISGDGAATDWLAAFVAEADLLDEAADWFVKAGYFGDYYVVLDASEEDEAGKITSFSPIGSSPLSTIAVYSKKDQTELRYLAKRWQVGDHWEACLYYDDATIALETANKKSADDASAYQPSLELDENDNPIPGSYVVKHEGGRPLVVHIPIDGKPYGRPVHRAAYGPQDAINKIHATMLAVIEQVGFPVRWGLQDPEAALEDDDLGEELGRDGLPVGADAPASGIGADGQLVVAGNTRLKNTPGAFWSLRGFKAVGEFSAAASDSLLKDLDWEVRAMSTTTGTPFFEFDESGTPPSGAARRLANGRINKHAEKVIRRLTQVMTTFTETALGAAGVTYTKLTIAFDPAETETDEDGMSLVDAKVKSGVPINLALKEAGYPAELVDAWWPESDHRVPPQLMVLLGDFLRFATQAVAGEALMPVELQAMLPQYLTQSRAEGFVTPPAPAPAAPPTGPALQQIDEQKAEDASVDAELLKAP